MRVEELIVYGKSKVSSTYAKMLLADLLGKNALELINILEDEVSPEIVKKYQEKIALLQKQKPIQYVIGNVNFYGNTYQVNEHVLIPRFETEELVENTLAFLEEHRDLKKVIDLGCGSGVIGITLKKKRPDLEVTLLDISKDALEVAKENAKNLNADVTFIESDMWDNVEDRFDVIISNPPYIKEEEEIDSLVKNNEPHLALYGGKDGLDFYRKILKDIKSHTKSSFLIAFEIGESQREELITLVKEILPSTKITAKKDLQDRDRMLFIYSEL